MKLAFLVITVIINFFNHSLINSQEINPANNKIDNIFKKESNTEDKTEGEKIHIVKIGDTISSISKLYSIDKNLIIKLNNLKDENYIYAGQNLTVSELTKNSKEDLNLINYHHIVQIGENLTEISIRYNLNLGYLIEINNLKNPDSIKVGQKLLLRKNNSLSSLGYQIIDNKKNNEFIKLNNRIYGPIIMQSKSYEKTQERKVFNVLNKENKKLILSINCDANELDVRVPGRKWRGGKPVKEEFEKELINDFC